MRKPAATSSALSADVRKAMVIDILSGHILESFFFFFKKEDYYKEKKER